MPTVVLTKAGETLRGEVPVDTNLVVKAGIRQFPHPALRYGCGMGKCGKCTSRIVAGGDALPAPNWKEVKVLGEKLAEGYRLICQLWISHDIELAQEWTPVGAERGATPGLQRERPNAA